jgi:hypothetical protein
MSDIDEADEGCDDRLHPLAAADSCPAVRIDADRPPKASRSGTDGVVRRLAIAAHEWWAVVSGPVVATALLDRLLHHAVVVQIGDSSYLLGQHAELMPEHVRSKAITAPPTPAPIPRPRGRPPRIGNAHPRARPAELGTFTPAFWGNFERR